MAATSTFIAFGAFTLPCSGSLTEPSATPNRKANSGWEGAIGLVDRPVIMARATYSHRQLEQRSLPAGPGARPLRRV